MWGAFGSETSASAAKCENWVVVLEVLLMVLLVVAMVVVCWRCGCGGVVMMVVG